MSQFKHTPEQARKLWVEDLRKNPPQCKEVLCELADGKPVGWCCLGRACEVFIAAEPDHGLVVIDDAGYLCRRYNGERLGLPAIVQEWLGIASKEGYYRKDPDTLLSRDNDSGTPFPAIADIIESNPPGLFKEAVDGP